MAVAFDAVTTDTQSPHDSSGPLTVNHTPTDTPTFATAAATVNDSGTGVSGVTYAGAAMTQVPLSPVSSGSIRHSLWYIDEPASGAQDVVFSFDASENVVVVVGIMTYTGGGAPGDSAAGTGTGAGTDDFAVLSTGQSLCMDALRAFNPPTVNAGQTERYDASSRAGSTEPGDNTGVTMGWDFTSALWLHIVFNILDVPAAGAAGFGAPSLPGLSPSAPGISAPPVGGSFNPVVGFGPSPFAARPFEFFAYSIFKTSLELENLYKKIRVI